MTERPGLLIVDKSAGMTSHDVVAKVRRLAGTRKVGHAGTLDPMATGVLVLGLNRATRLLTYIVGADKQYRATIRLGASTTTDDAEGETITALGCETPLATDLDGALDALRGNIRQVPSAVSAIKVNGQRSYKRVRAGEEVDLPARPVVVSQLDVIGEPRQVDKWIDLDVIVTCSSGTYIRALARDLGRTLGCGGHLTSLRRTRVGAWTLDQASELPELRLISLDTVCRQMFPSVTVTREQAARFRNGQAPELSVDQVVDGALVTLTAEDAGVIGLVRADRGRVKTEFVAHPA